MYTLVYFFPDTLRKFILKHAYTPYKTGVELDNRGTNVRGGGAARQITSQSELNS